MFRKLAALAALAAVAAASNVHDLTKDNFKEFVSTNDLVLAEFFAPWCGHCKSLAPEYEEAATSLQEKAIPLVKVDCTEHADLCKDYGVEGYPTIKVFQGPDNHSAYTGARKAAAIVSYMTKRALPAVSTVTPDSIEEFKTADKVVLVAFFAADDKASNETFTEVADRMRDNYLFGATSDADLAKAEGVSQPSIVLYKTFDERKNVFKDKFAKEQIAAFAKTSSTPLVGEVSPDSYQDYMEAGIPLAYIFAEDEAERTALAEKLKTVAVKHKGLINIATIDAKLYGSHAGNLNLNPEKFPSFAIQDPALNLKFPFDHETEINEKTIGDFVEQFVAGKLEPSIKSEPVPEKQEGPVTVLVGKNYEEIIKDKDKDVLVEYYAPWCGHCNSLAPKYEELAGMYASNPSYAKLVTIAKIDSTANDTPEQIQGFPTLKLFRAGSDKSPVEYTGDRSIEDLARFVLEKGTHKVDAFATPASSDSKPNLEETGEAAKAATTESSKSTGGAKETLKSAASMASEAAKVMVAPDEEPVHEEL